MQLSREYHPSIAFGHVDRSVEALDPRLSSIAAGSILCLRRAPEWNVTVIHHGSGATYDELTVVLDRFRTMNKHRAEWMAAQRLSEL